MICQRLRIITFLLKFIFKSVNINRDEATRKICDIPSYLLSSLKTVLCGLFVLCWYVCLYVCVMFEYMNSVCSQTCKRSFVVTLYISKWSETKPWHWMIDWDTTKTFSVATIFSITQEIAFLSFSIIINKKWLKRETTSTQVILNNESNLINDIHKLVLTMDITN